MTLPKKRVKTQVFLRQKTKKLIKNRHQARRENHVQKEIMVAVWIQIQPKRWLLVPKLVCGEMVNPQRLHATYDKIEIPPVQPIVTRVEQYGGVGILVLIAMKIM